MGEEYTFPSDDHPYSQVGIIGKGNFGVVILAKDRSNPKRQVAIKLLKRGRGLQGMAKYVQREVEYQASFRHPYIIELQEVFLTPTHLALVMEYAPHGTVVQYCIHQCVPISKREEHARFAFYHLVMALDYCHKMGVANRDLKLDNLLLGDCFGKLCVKLCDFGLCKHEMNSAARTIAGTVGYMAPEIVFDTEYQPKRADIWSCGVILYALLYGVFPFSVHPNGGAGDSAARRLEAGQYVFHDQVPISESCRDMIQKLLTRDPEKRIDMAGIMAHPWFQEIPQNSALMNEMIWRKSKDNPVLTPQLTADLKELVRRAEREGEVGEPVCKVKFGTFTRATS